MHAPRWQAAPSPCDDTGDGHDRSALDPFGGGVRVCNGEVDTASKLIADAAATHGAALALAAPLGRASEGSAGSLLGWPHRGGRLQGG